jgi:hypothetical protein
MSNLDKLLKLKELLDLKIITENDFKKKKAELLNNSNTGNNNSDTIKKEEIIVGDNEKVCPSCKCIIEKESEICTFCDYDFINNKIRYKIDYPIKSYNNLKKYISVFFLVVIFIFLGTWFFTENNSNINSEIEFKKHNIELDNKSQNKETPSKNTNDTVSKLSIDISESQNELNNKSIIQKIRADFKTEKKLFFIEKYKKEIAYEITLKNDTIVIDLNYRLNPNGRLPNSDGYYSRYQDILILKNGAIFNFVSNKISDGYRFINNTFYAKNYETKEYEEYILKPSKSNCKLTDILIP